MIQKTEIIFFVTFFSANTLCASAEKNTLEKKLLKAIKAYDLPKIQALVDAKADVNYQTGHNDMPLAAIFKTKKYNSAQACAIFKILASVDTLDIDAPNRYIFEPIIHRARAHKDLSFIRLCYRYGASPCCSMCSRPNVLTNCHSVEPKKTRKKHRKWKKTVGDNLPTPTVLNSIIFDYCFYSTSLPKRPQLYDVTFYTVQSHMDVD